MNESKSVNKIIGKVSDNFRPAIKDYWKLFYEQPDLFLVEQISRN